MLLARFRWFCQLLLRIVSMTTGEELDERCVCGPASKKGQLRTFMNDLDIVASGTSAHVAQSPG